MRVEDLFHHLEYLEEVATLTEQEWGTYQTALEFQEKVQRKMNRILENQNHPSYAKLILLDQSNLIGFISLFPSDGEERSDLSPWYATMYVKEEYRGHGYSKILNDALKAEAKRRGFTKIYLKSSLKNYYEKFGAIYLETLSNGESLFYMNVSEV